jgi:hypothetical protein
MKCCRSNIEVSIPNVAVLGMGLSFEFFPIHEQRAPAVDWFSSSDSA